MEEEKKAGKRLASSEGMSPAAKRGLIVILAVLIALAAAYLGLCGWVASSTKSMPGLSVAGRDVGGMDRGQVVQVLEGIETHPFAQNVMTVTYGDKTWQIDGQVLEVDVGATVNTVLWHGRYRGFLGYGGAWLKAALTRPELEPTAAFSQEGRQLVDQLAEEIAGEMGGDLTETTWKVEGDQLVFQIGTPGTGLDWGALRENILTMLVDGGGTYAVETTTANPAGVDLQEVHDQVYAEARDAVLDQETFEVTDSVRGLDFDLDEARTILEGAAWGTRAVVPLTVTEPQVSGDSLRGMLFRDVLGEAVAVTPGNSAQRNNIALASAACDGTVVMPGEVFSYNTATGSRTAEDGYQSASVYKDGKTVTEVGGGVCFPSSTIYYAALNANLKIVERHCHQFAVGYVPDGLDATVYDPILDFQFENDTEYPLMVDAKFEDRTLTVRMMGTKTDDVTVKMTNQVYDWISYETEYKLNPDLPAGTAPKELQNGYNGRKATTYRNLYDKDGNLISSTLEANSRYNVRPRIMEVSAADAALYGLNPDGTPMETQPADSPAPGETPAAGEPSAADPAASESLPPEGTPTDQPAESLPPAESQPPAESTPPAESVPGEDMPPANSQPPEEDPNGPPAGIPLS